jgi:hypothetical protein
MAQTSRLAHTRREQRDEDLNVVQHGIQNTDALEVNMAEDGRQKMTREAKNKQKFKTQQLFQQATSQMQN